MRFIHTFHGALPDQVIHLTFDTNLFTHPDAVLIFPFYKGQLLLTRHMKRGWELPGGKMEENEWPIHAAIRELFEETGAETEAVETIAQYKILERDRQSTKQIYVARVANLHPRPTGYETDSCRLFQVPPPFIEIISDTGFSELMKDQVYPITLKFILEHKQAFIK